VNRIDDNLNIIDGDVNVIEHDVNVIDRDVNVIDVYHQRYEDVVNVIDRLAAVAVHRVSARAAFNGARASPPVSSTAISP
jgi:hypothetical protein